MQMVQKYRVINEKLEIWGRAQREAARRRMCDGGSIQEERGGGEIYLAAVTCLKSNAVAYTERALST